jgi:hypothetical protein
MTSVRPRSRELAERSSNGTQVRLLWRRGTRHLWVEVREPDGGALAISVQPERALDAFHHLCAHPSLHRVLLPAESLAVYDRGSRQPARNTREQ